MSSTVHHNRSACRDPSQIATHCQCSSAAAGAVSASSHWNNNNNNNNRIYIAPYASYRGAGNGPSQFTAVPVIAMLHLTYGNSFCACARCTHTPTPQTALICGLFIISLRISSLPTSRDATSGTVVYTRPTSSLASVINRWAVYIMACAVVQQWRLKQFASGGTIFFDVPPLFSCVPHMRGTTIVCYRLRDNWSVP